MQTNIRDLKAHLSEYLRQVEAGETVTVSIRNQPVARIVPLAGRTRELTAEPGISWNGRKPKGLPEAEVMPEGVSVAAWVLEDRR